MTAGESESASRHPDYHALGFTISIAVVLIGGAFVLNALLLFLLARRLTDSPSV